MNVAELFIRRPVMTASAPVPRSTSSTVPGPAKSSNSEFSVVRRPVRTSWFYLHEPWRAGWACARHVQVRTRRIGQVLGYVPAAARFQHTFGGRRIPGELALRADRASDQFATAVGAHPLEHTGCATVAERALERADHGLGGVRRQVPVATLAIRSKLKHRVPQVEKSKPDYCWTRNLRANARSHINCAASQNLAKFPFTVCSHRDNISTGDQGCVSIAWCMREGDSDRLVEHGPEMKTGAPSALSSHLESSVPSSAALIARQQIGWQPWRLAFPLQERGSAVPADARPQRSRSCRRVTIPA